MKETVWSKESKRRRRRRRLFVKLREVRVRVRRDYPVVAGRMVHPTSREIRARAVEQDPSYKHPCARGV